VAPADRRPSRVTPSKKQLAEEAAASGRRGSKSAKAAPPAKGSKGTSDATKAPKAKAEVVVPDAVEAGGAADATPRKGRLPQAAAPARSTSFFGRLLPPRPVPVVAAAADDEQEPVGRPVPADGRRYGAGAILLVFLGAQVLASLAYALVIPNTEYDPRAVTGLGGAVGRAADQFGNAQAIVIAPPVPLWLSTLLQLPLWAALIIGPCWLATKRGRGIIADLGLRMKARDVPLGLAIGVACQLIMVPALYWVVFKAIGVQDVSAQARALTDRATSPVSVLLLFLIVGIGAPVAEEIYFRGMALPIFRRKLRARWAIVASAAFFAATHFQPLQFPALLVFGVILGVLTVRFQRLGPALWAHVGFNIVAAITLVWNLGFG